MKRIVNICVLICVVLFAGSFFPSQSRAGEQTRKAVYHCDYGDAGRVNAMLRNIYNLVDYYTVNNLPYDVKVVSNSACVQYLLKDVKGTKFSKNKVPEKLSTSIRERMQSLAEGYGVQFEQCDITLKRTNIDRKRLKPFVQTTPSGQVRVVELQEQGFAYIKVK